MRARKRALFHCRRFQPTEYIRWCGDGGGGAGAGAVAGAQFASSKFRDSEGKGGDFCIRSNRKNRDSAAGGVLMVEG